MSEQTPQGDDKPEFDGPENGSDAEGWEALSEEPSGGTLSPSDELEAALKEASDAVEARATGPTEAPGSVDKITIEALSEELQALKAAFEEKQQELDKANDAHLRLQAEFENFRRRGLKERQEAHNFGHQNLVKDLLPAVDNFDRAIAHTEQSAGEELEALLQGVQLVRREIMAALGNHGVSEVEAEDRVFDPAVHEAMAQVPREDVPPNTVVEVLQKGYVLRDRMLRPARVIVSRKPEEGEDASGAESSS